MISKRQTFNDGICTMATIINANSLKIKQAGIRYDNRTVGSERFYKAAEYQHRCDKVIRIPLIAEPQATDIVIINGDQYNVIQVQMIKDAKPQAWQLSIEKRKKRLEIHVNES